MTLMLSVLSVVYAVRRVNAGHCNFVVLSVVILNIMMQMSFRPIDILFCQMLNGQLFGGQKGRLPRLIFN